MDERIVVRFFILLLPFSINPMIPGSTMTVVKKQVATPIARTHPNCAHPRNTENMSEPKANPVVSDVRKIALPVLAKTVRILPDPS
jgi:hypothetical protein